MGGLGARQVALGFLRTESTLFAEAEQAFEVFP